jgi:uncharacterized YkwD family protein
MIKKISFVTALAAVLLFGGAFQTSAHAQSNQGNYTYKVQYSVNGNSVSKQDFQSLLENYFKNYQINWDELDKDKKNNQEQQAPEKEEEEKTSEQDQNQNEEPQTQNPAPEKQEQADQPEKAPTPPETKQPQEQKQEQPKQEQSQQLNQFEQQVVELTNQEREKQGLAPLKVDVELSKVAREKSADMARNNYFSHNSPTYGSPFEMMNQFGISYRTAGENIAKGQRTPEEVVNAWMNSEGHRANILNANFTHIGVGYVEQGNVWTQMFIGK